MDLQLEGNESEVPEIAKERDKISEVENSNLTFRLENLEAQIRQFFDMKTQRKDEEVLKLQLKMSQKLKLIRRLKCTTAKYREELTDKDNSLKKMKKHIKRIWNLLFVFRSKLEETEQLTAKEKNEIRHQYEEFLTLGIPEIIGKPNNTFNMLNDIPEKSTNFFNPSENHVKNSCLKTNGATGTEKNATSSNYAPSVLQSQIITVPSSNGGLEKNYQSLKDNTPQALKHLGAESSTLCPPDVMNHENRSSIYTKESFSGVFSNSQKSLTDMLPQQLGIPLHSEDFASQELGAVENVLDEMEHSLEERSCTADGNKSGEGFSVQMSQDNVMQNSSQEKESFEMTGSENALSDSLSDDLAMSDDSMPSSVLNPGEASNGEDSDKDSPTQVGLVGNELQQKIQSFKNGAISDCMSPESVVEDFTLSDERLAFESPFKEQGMSLKSVEKDGTDASDDLETELHNVSQQKDLPSSNFQKIIQQSDIDGLQAGLGDDSVKSIKIKSLGYTVATESETENKVSPSKHPDSENIIKEIKFSSKQNSLIFPSTPDSLSSIKEIGIGNYITYIKHTKKAMKDNKGESRLEGLFQFYRRYKFSTVDIKQRARSLVKIAINPNLSLDVSILLFHTFNYLQKSQKNPLHCFASNGNPSSLLPLDENCIVTALFLTESKKRPRFEGLLRTALTTTYNLILSKKGFNPLGLASLCRFLTEICRRQGNTANPVILCAGLLKMRHKWAAYLTASVAGVWPELFQIGNKLQAEELLFQSSILYGARKRSKPYTATKWENCQNVISKYFTAPSVNNARSAISNMKQLIEIRCKNSSWNSQFLMSALVILAAHEDWDWTEEHLLNQFIIPNLTKFGSETLDEHAFDLFCNLYVDVLLLKPQNPLDTVLTNFFNSSVTVNGKHFVRDSAALALMRFVYQKNRLLPSFLSSWFESNQQNPKMQQIKPIIIRRAMSESLKFLKLEDIQQNEDVKADTPTNKINQNSDDPQHPGVVDTNSNFDSEEESVEEIETEEESVKQIEAEEESVEAEEESVEAEEEFVEQIEAEEESVKQIEAEEESVEAEEESVEAEEEFVEQIEAGEESVEQIEAEEESVKQIEAEEESVEAEEELVAEIEAEEQSIEEIEDEEDIDGWMPQDCTLRCRSIRIGSYKVHSPEFSSCVKVLLSPHSLSFQAPMLSEPDKPVRIFLEKGDVKKMYVFFGRCFLMMSVLTTPKFGELVRRALHMTSNESQYFDPATKDDKTQKLTFMIESLPEDQRCFIKKDLFGSNKVVVLSQDAANEILMKSASKKVQLKTRGITRQSKNMSEDQSELVTRSKARKANRKESLSVPRTNKPTTDKLEERPSARAKYESISEEGSEFKPSTYEFTTEESEKELYTTARKRKTKKKQSLLKQINKVPTDKSEELNARSKKRGVKEVKSLLKGRGRKNTTHESKGPSARAKTRRAAESEKRVRKRLFTEKSTTEESEEEPCPKGKKRKRSTADGHKQSSITFKKRKFEGEESLFKQRIKKFTTDDSEE